jgi:hypothetical protein
MRYRRLYLIRAGQQESYLFLFSWRGQKGRKLNDIITMYRINILAGASSWNRRDPSSFSRQGFSAGHFGRDA